MTIPGELTPHCKTPIPFNSLVERNPLRLGYRIFDPDWRVNLLEDWATSNCELLQPGVTAPFSLQIPRQIVPRKGRIAIFVGLLYENKYWFRDRVPDDGFRAHIDTDLESETTPPPSAAPPDERAEKSFLPIEPPLSAAFAGRPPAEVLAAHARLAALSQTLEQRVGALETQLVDMRNRFELNVAAWERYLPVIMNAIAASNASAAEAHKLKVAVESVFRKYIPGEIS
jgi:hypothetical protein